MAAAATVALRRRSHISASCTTPRAATTATSASTAALTAMRSTVRVLSSAASGVRQDGSTSTSVAASSTMSTAATSVTTATILAAPPTARQLTPTSSTRSSESRACWKLIGLLSPVPAITRLFRGFMNRWRHHLMVAGILSCLLELRRRSVAQIAVLIERMTSLSFTAIGTATLVGSCASAEETQKTQKNTKKLIFSLS